MKTKKVLFVLAAFFAAFALLFAIGCGEGEGGGGSGPGGNGDSGSGGGGGGTGSGDDWGEPMPLIGFSADQTDVTVERNKNYDLSQHLIFTPPDADNQMVDWQSLNPAYVTVENTGVIKGISPGKTAVVRASARGGVNMTVDFNVTINFGADDVPVEGITLKPASGAVGEKVSIEVGQTQYYTIAFDPPNATMKTIDWGVKTGTDRLIAFPYLNNGMYCVDGIGPGTTTITAFALGGEGTVPASIQIEVLPKINGVEYDVIPIPPATYDLANGGARFKVRPFQGQGIATWGPDPKSYIAPWSQVAEWKSDKSGNYDLGAGYIDLKKPGTQVVTYWRRSINREALAAAGYGDGWTNDAGYGYGSIRLGCFTIELAGKQSQLNDDATTPNLQWNFAYYDLPRVSVLPWTHPVFRYAIPLEEFLNQENGSGSPRFDPGIHNVNTPAFASEREHYDTEVLTKLWMDRWNYWAHWQVGRVFMVPTNHWENMGGAFDGKAEIWVPK